VITRDEFRSRLENYAKACCVWETARSEGRSLIQADQGIRESRAALLAAFDQLAANAEQLGHSTAVTPTPYEVARDRIAEHDIVFALFALNDYKGMVAALRTLMDEHMRPLVKREKLMTDAERRRDSGVGEMLNVWAGRKVQPQD